MKKEKNWMQFFVHRNIFAAISIILSGGEKLGKPSGKSIEKTPMRFLSR